MKIAEYDPTISDSERFSRALTRILAVPHATIKTKMDAEKKKRRKKRSKASASHGAGV